MNLFARLFGKTPARPAAKPPSEFGASQFASGGSHYTKNAAPSSSGTRRELLRVVLRDSLRRHGIPSHWISADLLTATSRHREPGIHWRLSIRHWDERLPNLCVAFQNSLISRVQMFDPMAENWLMGISWEFALQDESPCPTMPPPAVWTEPPPAQVQAPAALPAAVAPAAMELVEAAMPAEGDIIAGPVQIDSTAADVRADLEKLMSALDAQYEAIDPSKTQPMYTSTEPASL